MIKTEATRVRGWLDGIKPGLIVNFGSSDQHFRTVQQPFIAEMLRGFRVIHVDQKSSEGVDLVADLTAQDFLEKAYGNLCNLVGDTVVGPIVGLLQNLLEHVEDRTSVLWNVTDFVDLVGITHIAVSVPHVWPYHPDPIDNMYRPTPDELSADICPYGFRVIDLATCPDPRGEISVGWFAAKSRRSGRSRLWTPS